MPAGAKASSIRLLILPLLVGTAAPGPGLGAALRAAFFHCGENIGSDLPVRWAAPAAGVRTARCEVRFLIAAAPASPSRRLPADVAQQDAPKTPPQGHHRSPFSPPPPRAEQPRFRPPVPRRNSQREPAFALLSPPRRFRPAENPPQIKSSRAAVRPPGSLEIDVTVSAVFSAQGALKNDMGPDAGTDGSCLRALHQLFAQADGRRAEDERPHIQAHGHQERALIAAAHVIEQADG